MKRDGKGKERARERWRDEERERLKRDGMKK